MASDWGINRWITDFGLNAVVQTGTEIFFIFGTGGLIVFLAYREFARSREFQTHYRTIVEQGLAGISVVQDDRFLFVNRRFAEIFGYEPEELIGSVRVVDLIAPEDRDTVADSLRRRLDGEVDHVRYRYTGLRKDGGTILVEVYGRRIEWRGRPAVTSLHLDVTEAERLREQARRAQKMEALGELTGQVAHDFNNLLTTIISPLDLCEEELAPDDPAREELREAKDGAARAVTLTRRLLSFNRQRLYRRRPTDLTELVESMEPMLRRLTGSGVELELDLAADLPAVEVDPSHFEQVALNLVTNARDASEGRGEIRLATRAEASEDPSRRSVVLEVADDGKGMDEETRKQVFEPFFTTRERGTGLGLAITHGIVTQVGGEISVSSRPGLGATFLIRLPASARAPEPLREDEAGPEKGEESAAAQGETILVVEDQEPVLRVTTRILERHGFQVLSALDGGEAIRVADEYPGEIDLVLTDVGLPDMDGTELVSRIVERDPDVEVCYMSGRSDEEVLDRLARESTHVFLEKPFSVQQLLGAVRSAIEGGEGRNLRAG